MSFTVRDAGPEDVEAIHRTTIAAFEEYRHTLNPSSSALDESPTDVAGALERGGAVLVLEGAEAVGSARWEPRPDHLYVERVAVVPWRRRQGIASLLMRRMEEIAREQARGEIRLGVRQSLPGNVAFYEALGYRVLAREPHPRGPDTVVWLGKRVTD